MAFLNRWWKAFYRRILDHVFRFFHSKNNGLKNFGYDIILIHGLCEYFFNKPPRLVLRISQFITIDSFILILTIFFLHFLFFFLYDTISNLNQLCLSYFHIFPIFLPLIPISLKITHSISITISQIRYNHKSKRH